MVYSLKEISIHLGVDKRDAWFTSGHVDEPMRATAITVDTGDNTVLVHSFGDNKDRIYHGFHWKGVLSDPVPLNDLPYGDGPTADTTAGYHNA